MRITINDVKLQLGITETYDIVNAIRNSSGDTFKSYVPLANADNVAEIGAGILQSQTVQNEFITALVDRIGLVVIRNIQLRNPLKRFKKGQMPLGRTIEEIFVDLVKANKYDAEESEETVFKRTIPNVKVLFHERNRQDRYDQTIQDDSLKTAFISWAKFGDFLSSIINAIYNSAEVDEYEYMKLLIDNYYSKGLFKIEKVNTVTDETSAREFVKKVRASASKMTLPQGSRDFNSLAVRTRSDMENLHLFIDADLNAVTDVDVLAKAFNLDKSTLLGNITVIDGFASAGLEAVLVDESFFMVYDNLLKMETIRNPKGLYWNYFYHVWQTLSVSRFANAVAFVSGEVEPVTQVIVDPTIGSLKAGKTKQYTAYVRTTDSVERDVVWSITPQSNTVVEAGTTISADGLLTVAPTQTGDLNILATVTYSKDVNGTPTDFTVVGEAVVNVVPQL